MSETCETCRFAGQRYGYQQYPCQRHAPITIHDPGNNMGVYPEAFQPRWPMMQADDWCGDFELRTETGASQ